MRFTPCGTAKHVEQMGPGLMCSWHCDFEDGCVVAECALVIEKVWRLCASEFKLVFLQTNGSLPNVSLLLF